MNHIEVIQSIAGVAYRQRARLGVPSRRESYIRIDFR